MGIQIWNFLKTVHNDEGIYIFFPYEHYISFWTQRECEVLLITNLVQVFYFYVSKTYSSLYQMEGRSLCFSGRAPSYWTERLEFEPAQTSRVKPKTLK
jgi:hypothetical protein